MPVTLVRASLFPDLKRSQVYQITSNVVRKGVFYLAIDAERELANVYCVNEKGAPDSVDYSSLFLRTLATLRIDTSGVIVLAGRANLYQAVRDWSGDDAETLFSLIGWDTSDVEYDGALRAANSYFQDNQAYKFLLDPYADEEEFIVSDETSGDGAPLDDGGFEEPLPAEDGEDAAEDEAPE